jgi:ribosome-associated toxin RatA of RatAB toxin-antitoxin module
MGIAALLLALIMTPLSVFATPVPRLSAEQQSRVDQGEVVLLDVLPPGGDAASSQGGTAVALVHAQPDAVWRVLVDYKSHSGLYPRVVDARVLESNAAHALVRYTIGVGPFSFGFHVNNYPDTSRRRLTWRLAADRPNDLFRDSWGYWNIDADRRGAVLTYSMAARTVLPQFLTRGAERDGLVETMKAVRERAERRS